MANVVHSVADGTRCVLAVEQGGSLLERETLRLDDEEVEEDELEGDPAAVDDIVLPAQIIEGDGVNVLVEDEGKGDGEVEDAQTFCTEAVGQDFDCVSDDERAEGQTVMEKRQGLLKKHYQVRQRTRSRRRRGI